MTAKEKAEWRRLSKKWSVGRATRKEMLRCMALSRKASVKVLIAASK